MHFLKSQETTNPGGKKSTQKLLKALRKKQEKCFMWSFLPCVLSMQITHRQHLINIDTGRLEDNSISFIYRVLHIFWPGMKWQFSQHVPTIFKNIFPKTRVHKGHRVGRNCFWSMSRLFAESKALGLNNMAKKYFCICNSFTCFFINLKTTNLL